MKQPARFWMVKGSGPAHIVHDSLTAAEAEAGRLAREYPGVSFYVMEAIACHRRVDVERIDLRGPGASVDDGLELPF